MKRASWRCRRSAGVSLPELMLLMSLATVVLTMSAQLIQRFYRAHGRATEFYNLERSQRRLARQFRSDVHAARTASLPDGADRPLLSLQGESGDEVAYQFTRRKLLRTARRNGQVTARDEYGYPAGTDWRVLELDNPRRLLLELFALEPQEQAGKTASRLPPSFVPACLRVEACLARDSQAARREARP